MRGLSGFDQILFAGLTCPQPHGIGGMFVPGPTGEFRLHENAVVELAQRILEIFGHLRHLSLAMARLGAGEKIAEESAGIAELLGLDTKLVALLCFEMRGRIEAA